MRHKRIKDKNGNWTCSCKTSCKQYVAMCLQEWAKMTGHMETAYTVKEGKRHLVGGPYQGPLIGPDDSIGCLLVYDTLTALRKAHGRKMKYTIIRKIKNDIN